ncbi:uncharacterized protein [Primulina eburnea]|uniref:uncharacterized protein isoform X2 n=1 Tax=Primulina eburnea TaxID=1245227 RepID=UPI003C6BF814
MANLWCRCSWSSWGSYFTFVTILQLFHCFLYRKVASATSKPRSWFGPNGLYIIELPCPICRGRGYTPCTQCGVERSRSDCLKFTCHQCLGDCIIWEESIDERLWEKARSISPLKVKEDDEVDNLDTKLDVRRKTERVYRSSRRVKFYCHDCGCECHRRNYCPQATVRVALGQFHCCLCTREGV